MLTKGQSTPIWARPINEERYRERVISNLNRHAQSLGLQVLPGALSPTPA
jgi:hypothetical protein